MEYLRTLPEIDGERIGLVGHSQGGWVVQLAGSLDKRVNLVVSLAGPTVTVQEQVLKNVELQLICEGYEEKELERKLRKQEQKNKRQIFFGKWFPFFELRLMSNILPFDPTEALRSLTQPALLAFAELDSMVPPDQNRTRFEEIFPKGAPSHVTWFTAESTDHMFRITDTVCFDYDASLNNSYSEEFRTFLGAWIDANVKK